jgi:hypothetical protein
VNLNAPRLIQVGLGAAGLFAGYKVGSTIIANTRKEDLTGPATRVVGMDGQWIQEQANTPLTDKLVKGLLGVGAGAAGLGALLVLGHSPSLAASSLARSVGGVLLFAGGAGLIGGAIAAADRTSDTTIRPNHAPVTDGIAVSAPDAPATPATPAATPTTPAAPAPSSSTTTAPATPAAPATP